MKDVIISITGTQNYDIGEQDAVELVTSGQYEHSKDSSFLSYMESELTGLDGTKTSFFVDPLSVTMLREGSLNSRMVFEQGRKHVFLYETPYGSSTMGVNTNKMKIKLDEHGGNMEIDYIIELDHTIIGRNSFIINVREKGGIQSQCQI